MTAKEQISNCMVIDLQIKLMVYIPYSGKFSYGAKFRIFRIKLQDAKI